MPALADNAPPDDSTRSLYTRAESVPTLVQQDSGTWALSGAWNLRNIAALSQLLESLTPDSHAAVLNGQALTAFDSAGAWVLQTWLKKNAASTTLLHWQPRWQSLLEAAQEHAKAPVTAATVPRPLARLGQSTLNAGAQSQELLVFLGATAQVTLGLVRHPARLRWRSVLHHVQIGGFDALPIVGLMSFLLGVVVAYQGADQLRHYGANIFVVDLVGYAMLREFAPLMTAIIIAGRSGSAFAAQIGSMVVAEEIDALRTIGIDPTELLVLPRVLALAIALPLLTVFADITGVGGGMVMASLQLDIGWREFLERFGREMQGSSLLVGLGKSLVFALVIGVIGCFQGLRTRGSADSVGRQTTLSVVQAIFIVIVVDAAFSIVFNWLDL